MAAKATHRGTCQACGAAQRLPAGVLSKHGYIVNWGFFHGVCQGSGKLPYEQSFDLIERFIAYAQGEKERLETFRAGLLVEPAEPKCYKRLYLQDKRTRKYDYRWTQVEITGEPFTSSAFSDGRTRYRVHYVGPEGKQQMHTTVADLGELIAIAAAENRTYAAAVQRDIDGIDRYIAVAAPPHRRVEARRSPTS